MYLRYVNRPPKYQMMELITNLGTKSSGAELCIATFYQRLTDQVEHLFNIFKVEYFVCHSTNKLLIYNIFNIHHFTKLY